MVGAGPSALAAAIVCTRGGVRVTIAAEAPRRTLARADPQRSPSETIHPGIESLLRELGASDLPGAASRGTYRGIWRDGVFSPLGGDELGPWIGHHVDRARFDAALLAHAVRCGAVHVPHKVVDVLRLPDRVGGVSTSGGAVSADYVVDGSGRHRVLGRRLGFEERVSSPPMIAWSAMVHPDRQGGDPRFRTKLDGWSWIAPEADGLATWTRLVVGTGSRVARPAPEEGSLAGPLVGADVRWRIFRPLVMEGLLLAGDAAGVIDPGGGQGVFRALLTGMMAGKAVVEALARPSTAALVLARYDAWFVEQYEAQVSRLRAYSAF
jgi:flavin-dependent dehydrogenase